MSINLYYYKKRIEELKVKIIAYAKMDNDAKVKELEKEVANCEKYLKSNRG